MTDHDQIRQVLAVYCHALDDGEYERLAEIFDDDTVYELTGGPYVGIDASVAGLRSLLGDRPRKRHVLGASEIWVDGQQAEVLSDWYTVDIGEDASLSFARAGRWRDHLEHRANRWVIVRRQIERL